jgi:CheY-like chemotaxis protein
MRKANILAVDDKRANLIALEAVLGADHNVLFADSGAKAIALLKKRSDIDVILMDVQMPDMDGFEAAAHIKTLSGCEDIPIIFVTAVYSEDPYVKRGYEVGGMDYFSKPFDPEILRKKVAIYASFRLKADVLKARERQIRDSEELLSAGRKLSAMLESLPVGVLIADAEGMICQTTEEVSRILKATEAAARDSYGEIIGWWDASGRMLKDERGPLGRALAKGEATHSERMDIRCCDGSSKTICASAFPLYRLEGRIAGAVVLIQDRTECMSIEHDLEQRVTKLIGVGVELEEAQQPGLV